MAEEHAFDPHVEGWLPADSSAMSVFVTQLELPAQIGAYAHERDRLQILVFDIEARIRPPSSDEIGDTCDYAGIVELVRQILREGHIVLVETVARRVAETVLSQPHVLGVKVRVAKPGAVREAREVGAMIVC